MLSGELNKSVSRPGELRCGEYSFKLKMNPWQHPIFDENIQHLLVLVTSLRNRCGGVIYLVTDDMQTVKQETFLVYEERLYALIDKNLESLHLLINMFQVCQQSDTHRAWAVLLLKKVYNTLKYPPVITITFDMDIFGQMHTRPMSDTQTQSNRVSTLVSPGQETETIRKVPYLTEPEISSVSSTATYLHHIYFSSCPRLDWTENNKDWQKYVKTKEFNIDVIVRSCSVWKPMQPMNITPNRDSLRFLFESENDMDETLSTIATKKPGCAVVCRTWRFHISEQNINEDLPPGHICDILTVTDTGRLSFWVVVDSLGDDSFYSQMEYLMTTGRMLKYQIMQKGEGYDMSNLWIWCHLLPLHKSHHTKTAVKLRLFESQEIQSHLYHMYQDGVDVVVLQQVLTMLIISKESPLKRYAVAHTNITLSTPQLEVLMEVKAKVKYITGPAASGKSFTAASLCKMYGKEKSVYICTTKEFLEYLKFNGHIGTLVLGDQDLMKEIKSGTFESKICVVIDDCHKFTCTRKSMKKLFLLLKENRHMSLFVFANNDFQSFDRRQQEAVHDCIRDLTRTVLKEDPLKFSLTEIYRNTRKVVSFLQAAILDVHDGLQKIKSGNTENGEGVECIVISSLWENNPNNDLTVYLCSLLGSGKYNQSEVAVLFESSYTMDQIMQCKKILAEQVPNITLQSAATFPRIGIIVDSVDSFYGLDACVCVFLLSRTQKTSVHPHRGICQRRRSECEMSIYNPRYEVFLASRATHKAVFVVPELHEDLVYQMKFDIFKVHVYIYIYVAVSRSLL